MADRFLQVWANSAHTTLGLFWMAFWAFGFGYFVSSLVQVFVTRKTMKKKMGEAGPKSVFMATFFGFISSSCSFAALATTRSLFTKGAGLVPSLAFLLASTNLVIELGIIIAVFLSWQFVVGEYVGGILLILLMWLLVKLTLPAWLEKEARDNAQEQFKDDEEVNDKNLKQKFFSFNSWCEVACRYVMEWKMVWKDVTIGFTAAGIISAAVPKEFFHALFWGAGTDSPSFIQVLAQTIAGPLAAFFTFIGSMGNIPLASVLYSNGVSFAAIMAFIFSDLIVIPVLRIQAKYFGWKMAIYILAIFLTVLIISALGLHYAFSFFGYLPELSTVQEASQRDYFSLDLTFALNCLFLILSGFFLWWRTFVAEKSVVTSVEKLSERILLVMAFASIFWLLGGTVIWFKFNVL